MATPATAPLLPTSALSFKTSDSAVASGNLDWAKYLKAPADDAIDRAKLALEAKGQTVTVVNDRAAALQKLVSLLPEAVSVFVSGSTTLDEVGFTDLLKQGTHKWDNVKGRLFAAPPEKRGSILQEGFYADYYLTSLAALTEEGDMVTVDASSTRTGPHTTAKNVIVVLSSNKIVPTTREAEERAKTFCFPLESARMRLVHNAPGSLLAYYLAIKAPSKGKYHVILVKNEQLGY